MEKILHDLQKKVARIKTIMISVATGDSLIQDRDEEYQELHRSIQDDLINLKQAEIYLVDKNVFHSLRDFHSYWKGYLKSYQDRRDYIRELYQELGKEISAKLGNEMLEHVSEGVSGNKEVLLCRHCGNETLHTVLYQYDYDLMTWDRSRNNFPVRAYCFLVKCETCMKPSLYGNWDLSDDPNNLKEAKLLYPISGEMPKIVPEEIRNTYRKASRIKRIDPNAFAVQIRRALEYMCKDQDAKGKTLQAKLQDMGEREMIPPTLVETTDVLRNLGNIGAHAGEAEVTSESANIVDDFFRLIVEYIYIIPNKVEEITEKMKDI